MTNQTLVVGSVRRHWSDYDVLRSLKCEVTCLRAAANHARSLARLFDEAAAGRLPLAALAEEVRVITEQLVATAESSARAASLPGPLMSSQHHT